MITANLSSAATIRTYIGTVMDIMSEPGTFFETHSKASPIRPLFILLVSSLVYTAACALIYVNPRPWTVSGILFVNALGTPVAGAVVGYLVIRFINGDHASFRQILGIYAYASAAILLVAWMPYALLVAEPWRWWLIGKGLIRGCGFSRRMTSFLIGITIIALVCIYKLLMRLTA